MGKKHCRNQFTHQIISMRWKHPFIVAFLLCGASILSITAPLSLAAKTDVDYDLCPTTDLSCLLPNGSTVKFINVKKCDWEINILSKIGSDSKCEKAKESKEVTNECKCGSLLIQNMPQTDCSTLSTYLIKTNKISEQCVWKIPKGYNADNTKKIKWTPLAPTLSINIPTIKPFTTEGLEKPDAEGNVYIPYIGQYAAGVYKYLLLIAGIIAAVRIIAAGFNYIAAGGSSQKIEEAKSGIGHALIGLVLVLGSYLLLYTINPDLVQFKSLKIKVVENVVLTEFTDNFDSTSYDAGSDSDDGSSFPNFKQINYKTPFAMSSCPSETIANSGCGPTSLSMVIKSFGYGVTPPDIAKLWVDYGYLKNGTSCGAVGHGGMFTDKKLFEKFNFTSINLGTNKNKIIEEVKKGHPVIASMKPVSSSQPSRWTQGGHFVVVFKINPDGTLFIRDSGRRALCVQETNKCPSGATTSLTAVNPDLFFPFVKSATAFIKK